MPVTTLHPEFERLCSGLAKICPDPAVFSVSSHGNVLKKQPHPPGKIAQTEANSSQSDRIVSDGIQIEFRRGGWRFDPFFIDFQFNFPGRTQLPPTLCNLGVVPSRNDVWP